MSLPTVLPVEAGRRSRWANVPVAILFLILPHVVYSFLWYGPNHQTLGNDYVLHQPGQQMLFMQGIRDGYFPLWAPADSGGMPFAAYIFAGQYWPVTWLMLAWEPVFDGHQLQILTHLRLFALSLAGFFTYLVMRRLRLATYPALLAGVVFIFNFRMLDAFRYGMSLDVALWLPVLIYLAECIVTRPRTSLLLAYALVQYLLVVPGQLQEALYCVCFVNLFFLLRSLMTMPAGQVQRAVRWLGTRAACFGAAQALGFSLAAVMFIPIMQDVVPLWPARDSGNPDFYYMHHLTWPSALYNLFYPWLADVNSGYYCAQIIWILLPLAPVILLVGSDRFSTKQRRTLIFFLGMLTCCVLYSLGPLTPVAGLANALFPQLKLFRNPGRVMTIGMFCLAAVSAYALSRLCDDIRTRGKATLIAAAGCAIYLAAGILLAVGIAGGWVDVREHHVSLPLFWNAPKYSPAVIHGDPAMMMDMALTIGAVALSNLAIILFCRHRRSAGLALALPLIAVLLFEASTYHRRGTWLEETPVASTHSARFGEVDIYHTRSREQPPFYVYNPDPMANPTSDMVPKRLSEFLRQGGDPARYIYSQNVPGHEIPRAYVTPAVRLVNGNDVATLAQMDPLVTSIIDTADPVNVRAPHDDSLIRLAQPQAELLPGHDRARFLESRAAIELVEYTFNKAVFQVSTPHGGLFNYSDAYAEGWRATIDGEPVPVYRSNHVFKAITLPAGSRRVEFVFDPPSFRLGIAISLASLCVCAGLGASCFFTATRRCLIVGVLCTLLAAPVARYAHQGIYRMVTKSGFVDDGPGRLRMPARDHPAGHIAGAAQSKRSVPRSMY